MIYSMTAFANSQVSFAWGNVAWEIRSINHRYLEINFRLPEPFTSLEPILREKLKLRLQRGKVDILLRVRLNSFNEHALAINKSLAQQLMQAHQEISQLLSQPSSLNSIDILRWPGILQTQELDTDASKPAVLNSFDSVLADLIAMRQREGTALTAILMTKLDVMAEKIAALKPLLDTINSTQREKLLTRLAQAKINFDESRLAQELLFYAQKIDVAEELERLATHVKEARSVIMGTSSAGKRLDFLMQEFNREANTLGAKSVAIETSQAALELKILIEQMREQVQNIE